MISTFELSNFDGTDEVSGCMLSEEEWIDRK